MTTGVGGLHYLQCAVLRLLLAALALYWAASARVQVDAAAQQIAEGIRLTVHVDNGVHHGGIGQVFRCQTREKVLVVGLAGVEGQLPAADGVHARLISQVVVGGGGDPLDTEIVFALDAPEIGFCGSCVRVSDISRVINDEPCGLSFQRRRLLNDPLCRAHRLLGFPQIGCCLVICHRPVVLG